MAGTLPLPTPRKPLESWLAILHQIQELTQASSYSPANAGPAPTGTGTTTGLGGVIPTVIPSVTLAPTTITTGGTTLVVSTPTIVSNTQLSTTNQPAAGAMATPAVALVAAGLAAALF